MNTMFSRPRFVSIASLAFVGLSGCESALVAEGCTRISIPGLTILVVDSISNVAPPSTSLVRISDGDYISDLAGAPAGNGLRYAGAYDRKGSYGLLIKAAGYKDYTATNIRVLEDGCHVKTSGVTAKLQRTP